jgi:hypothetical protein
MGVTFRPQLNATTIKPRPFRISIGARQGLPGPPGASGPSQFLSVMSSSVLSASRAVVMAGELAVYASSAVGSPQFVVGLTKTAAAIGAQVEIQTFGKFQDASWNWIDGPVFLASDGFLTQFPSSSNQCVQIGVVIAPTTLLIDIRPPILRI